MNNIELIPYPIRLSIDEFKKWYQNNKQYVDNTDTRIINKRIIIYDSNGHEYKIMRNKGDIKIIPKDYRQFPRSKMINDIDKLESLNADVKYLQDELRRVTDLLISKGIDKQNGETKQYGPV